MTAGSPAQWPPPSAVTDGSGMLRRPRTRSQPHASVIEPGAVLQHGALPRASGREEAVDLPQAVGAFGGYDEHQVRVPDRLLDEVSLGQLPQVAVEVERQRALVGLEALDDGP